MTDLAKRFVTVQPREKAGSRTAARFDYQIHWALCHLLDLHGKRSDYLLVFDFQDDVAVLDSEANPSRVAFYQIKTKDPGTWTLQDLMRRKKGKKGPTLSILGKLYDNVLRFPDHTESMHLVSNAKFRVELKNKEIKSIDKDVITCAELSDSELRKISAKLREEHALTSDPERQDCLYLHVAELHLTGHVEHAKGQLVDFLENLYPDVEYRITPIYQSLIGEIRRRNKYTGAVNTFDDLLKHKAIGRKLFEEILSVVGVRENPRVVWDRIEGRLNHEALGIPQIRRIRDRWQRYALERLDYTNVQLRELTAKIKGIVEDVPDSFVNCTSVCAEVLRQLGSARTSPQVYDDDYVWAITLSVLYE